MTRGVPSSCRFICAIDFSVSDICPSPPIISLRSTYLWKYKGLLVEPSLTNCLHFRGQIFCYHFCHWFHIKPPFILLQKCAPRRDSQGTKSIIRFKAQNCIIQVLYYCTAWHFSLSEMNFFVKNVRKEKITLICVKKKSVVQTYSIIHSIIKKKLYWKKLKNTTLFSIKESKI